jgi:ankyrin repeat protein
VHVAAYLLSRGADATRVNSFGNTALHLACQKGQAVHPIRT